MNRGTPISGSLIVKATIFESTDQLINWEQAANVTDVKDTAILLLGSGRCRRFGPLRWQFLPIYVDKIRVDRNFFLAVLPFFFAIFPCRFAIFLCSKTGAGFPMNSLSPVFFSSKRSFSGTSWPCFLQAPPRQRRWRHRQFQWQTWRWGQLRWWDPWLFRVRVREKTMGLRFFFLLVIGDRRSRIDDSS